MVDALRQAGWKKTPLGYYKSGSLIKEIGGFDFYIRERSFEDFLKKSSNVNLKKLLENQEIKGFLESGSNQSMGGPQSDLTPTLAGQNNLPALSGFSGFSSLQKIGSGVSSIVISFDSEWENGAPGTDRSMLSWQFATISGNNLVEFVFLKTGKKDLDIEDALGTILDYLGVKAVDLRQVMRYQYCPEWDDIKDKPVVITTDEYSEATNNAKYIFRNGAFVKELINDRPDKMVPRSSRDWAWFHTIYDYKGVDRINVTLVCHAAKADMSSFYKGYNYYKSDYNYLLRCLSDVQGGLVSLQPVKLNPRSHKHIYATNKHIYPLLLNVRDTMCHAPAGKKSLEVLGGVVGINKISKVTEADKEHMQNLLSKDPVLFFEYAAIDSVVTLLYASALYGYNKEIPITVTSVTAKVMKENMAEYLDVNTKGDAFNLKYRGLMKVSHGKVAREDRPGYVESTSLEPISDAANTVQYMASQAFHGGYNSCSEVGYFGYKTYDYDLMNAYPTAMALIPDIDWEHPILHEELRKELTISMWSGVGGLNPVIPFVGYVRFEFPKTVKFPCIPVNVDGIPVYPRTSEGMEGVYVAGPYVYLALMLGAKVYCERGYFLNTLRNKEDPLEESRSLANAVKQLVADRKTAKQKYGKGSLEERILKTMVNSGYGKNAQNVVQKNTWSAYKDEMESIGCSSITNPVSAMMITSIVQCVLIAAQNQIKDLGYMSCSVTTDGFISNCPYEVLDDLDLFGFKQFMVASRKFLSGDSRMWEVKHIQDDLLNFTTRGNVSLHNVQKTKAGTETGNPIIYNGEPYPGVCAHNGTKSGFPSDSYEDRLWLYKQVLSRTGTVYFTVNEWPSYKSIVNGEAFAVKKVGKNMRMDFDMKRKPVKSGFTTDVVVLDGSEYQIAHFDTEPFETVAEFRLYRQKKELTKVLRTEDDWAVFFAKVELKGTGAKVRDKDWAILNSCIMGYRAGMWDIPALQGLSVADKCAWIQSHNESKKRRFKETDWKNARRPDRQVNMLPMAIIRDKLIELGVTIN